MTARLTESPWTLLKNAAGTPREMLDKVRRLGGAFAAYADGDKLDGRLSRLQEIGYVEEVPTRLQLIVGSVDMLRFWISPAAADYYESRGIHFGFHQVLRILDEPAGMVDPTGFLSTVDSIIGHVMQVVHANPAYDLQLLESHDGGLEELEQQVVAMLAGTHPKAASIGAIVEEPDYHEKLLAFVREFRAAKDTDAPLRENIQNDPKWREIEKTFGTLPNAMKYFSRLPSRPLPAAWHILMVKEFPKHLGVH